jgi:hypothetical protein
MVNRAVQSELLVISTFQIDFAASAFICGFGVKIVALNFDFAKTNMFFCSILGVNAAEPDLGKTRKCVTICAAGVRHLKKDGYELYYRILVHFCKKVERGGHDRTQVSPHTF